MRLALETMMLSVAAVFALGSPVQADGDAESVSEVATEIREVSLQHKTDLQNFWISDVPHGSRAFFVSELNQIGDKSREIVELSNVDEEEISTENLEELI